MKRFKSLSTKYELQKIRQGIGFVIGCDEVGRACLAGPVVAGAVVIDLSCKLKDLRGVRDSKMLSPQQREVLEPLIKSHSIAWGIGVVSEKIIDEINIHHASLLAMRRAVENVLCHCEEPGPFVKGLGDEAILFKKKIASPSARNDKLIVVLDGKFTIPSFDMKQEAVVDGDAKILSVAAASIIAKVYRDNLMRQLHQKFPNYHLDQHKGYPTLQHRTAIKKFGLTPLHRLSFCHQYI